MAASSRVVRRYAKALFLLDGRNTNKARANLASLGVLLELFHLEAGKVLASPVWPTSIKNELLQYGLNQGDATAEVRGLVRSLVEAGRVDIIPQLVEEYKNLIDEADGLVRAELISATELATSDVDQISTKLAQLLSKKVQVTNKVDPSLLGGFVVKAGTKVVDLSLKTKLEALTQAAVAEA